MRRPLFTENWSIGQKTTVSHMLIAFASVALATVLCYIFGYQYTRGNVIEELERQATVIARKESSYAIQERASRGNMVELYQSLTNAAVFFVNLDGETVQMQRYIPHNAGLSEEAEQQETDYSPVELMDQIDRQFIDRILAGETVTAMQRFVFADGIILFVGAPITAGDEAVVGGVILAQPVEIMHAIGRELSTIVLIPGTISVILAAFLAFTQTRMLVRPIRRMTRVARRMAEGEYGDRVLIETEDEIGELGRTLNTLSVRLTEVIESLREERDRLELVIGSIGEGILAVDCELHVVHCNRSFLELMEVDSADELFRSERGEIDLLLELLGETISSRERRHTTFLNPSGRAIRAEISALPDVRMGQYGAVCLIADVSEAQRLEQMRRDYVANISHELRTPLTGIRGMIEPLIDGCMETEEEKQNCYAVIQRETVRLEKLVGEMLDMSRLQDGRISVELERLELPGILDAAIKGMSGLARESGVELRLELDGSRLDCLGNEDRIAQVLVILLDNAIDFTPRGGSVTVFARAEEKFVTVGVRDEGCGIEPKDLPLIWERFYKADRSRMRTKGTGLGLAIAKLVVELMGGEITAVSEPGRGSEFRFILNR